jgi:NAD(P)-dependent dehydrogenase (short-subunit alcohol dehydrogenase family)
VPDLTGRVAIVTGASRGIGRGVAVALAAHGARVAVCYLNGQSEAEGVVAEITTAGGTAMAVSGDVSQRSHVTAMLDAVIASFGRLDILVNVAGIAIWSDVLDATEADFDIQFATNVKGVFLTSQEAARRMIPMGKGKIINVTSVSATVVDTQLVPYCASKAAEEMLTKGLAAALAPHNIAVNSVAPGTVPTEMNRSNLERPGLRDALISETPFGRLGRPADVAGAVVFLASDAADYMVGATLVVDGGYSL